MTLPAPADSDDQPFELEFFYQPAYVPGRYRLMGFVASKTDAEGNKRYHQNTTDLSYDENELAQRFKGYAFVFPEKTCLLAKSDALWLDEKGDIYLADKLKPFDENGMIGQSKKIASMPEWNSDALWASHQTKIQGIENRLFRGINAIGLAGNAITHCGGQGSRADFWGKAIAAACDTLSFVMHTIIKQKEIRSENSTNNYTRFFAGALVTMSDIVVAKGIEPAQPAYEIASIGYELANIYGGLHPDAPDFNPKKLIGPK